MLPSKGSANAIIGFGAVTNPRSMSQSDTSPTACRWSMEPMAKDAVANPMLSIANSSLRSKRDKPRPLRALNWEEEFHRRQILRRKACTLLPHTPSPRRIAFPRHTSGPWDLDALPQHRANTVFTAVQVNAQQIGPCKQAGTCLMPGPQP